MNFFLVRTDVLTGGFEKVETAIKRYSNECRMMLEELLYFGVVG